MKVSSLMTRKIVSLKTSDTVEKALKLFSKHRISGCPVVSSGRVVGMITKTDIIKIIDVHSSIQSTDTSLFALVLAVIKSGEEFDGLKAALHKVMALPVKDFMKKNIRTVGIDEDVYTAARLMNKYDINRLPVVENGKLKGIVTRADIINTLAKM